jgi:hypothetical protein
MNISNAMAFQDYDYEADRNQVSVSSLKCNNINVNVNGLELEVLPSALSALLTGEEADASAYSYGSGTGNYGSASSGSEINDFRFICINNNNNTVVEEPIPSEPPTCEECFGANTILQAVIEDFLIEQTQTRDFTGQFPQFLTIPFDVDTIEQLCVILEGPNFHSNPLTVSLLDFVFTQIVIEQTGSHGLEAEIDALIECLIEAGVVIDDTT